MREREELAIKRKANLVLISCLVICLIIAMTMAGCGKKAPSTQPKEQAVPVQVAQVNQGVLADITTVTGKLEALDISNVVPGGAGGKVEAVHVELGDRVTKGQTLVVLEQAVAETAVRQAQLGITQAQQGVVQAQSALEASKINYEQAVANYERGKELYAGGVIPQGGSGGFETAFEIPYKQAKIDYEQVKPTALASAQAAVATAQAALDMAQEQYNNTLIKAPISGVVTAVNINPGEYASPGSPKPVVALVNLDKVVVLASVVESIINTIEQGQEVPVLISAVSNEPFTGVVTNIAPAADPTSKAYPIKVQINNPKHILKPGMFAEIQFQGRQPQTLLVPREAVVKLNNQDTVWVVQQNNQVRSRPVTVGIGDGQKIQIKEGLTVGEQIVVVGQSNLQEKTQVEIVSNDKDKDKDKDKGKGKTGDIVHENN